MKVDEIGAFIICRSRLTKVLAGTARGETGSKGGGGQVRLSDVNTWELVGFSKLVDMSLHIGGGHGRGWHLGVCE